MKQGLAIYERGRFLRQPPVRGNTQALLRHVLAAVAAEGIDTELDQRGGKHIHGCIALGDNPFILFN